MHPIAGARVVRQRATFVLEPVSYTHLDVYKRQVLRHCALADLSNKDVIAYPRKRPIGEHGRALIDRIRREIDSIHG